MRLSIIYNRFYCPHACLLLAEHSVASTRRTRPRRTRVSHAQMRRWTARGAQCPLGTASARYVTRFCSHEQMGNYVLVDTPPLKLMQLTGLLYIFDMSTYDLYNVLLLWHT
jgi:hypothetical protein